MYTVPGQVYYNASRRLIILKGVDGLVFVADSQASRAEANIESMHNLYENLETYGYDLESIPFAIQYNKRDMPNIMSPEELRAQINPMDLPDFEGVAIDGAGVFETLSCVSRLVVETLS
jgi:signal recognition particle receptor subunit beta